MARMEPNECGEVTAARHLEEVAQIAMGGHTVEEEGSDREQTKQRRAMMCFVLPLAKKIGASSSDDCDDGAKRMWRGDSRPSS